MIYLNQFTWGSNITQFAALKILFLSFFKKRRDTSAQNKDEQARHVLCYCSCSVTLLPRKISVSVVMNDWIKSGLLGGRQSKQKAEKHAELIEKQDKDDRWTVRHEQIKQAVWASAFFFCVLQITKTCSVADASHRLGKCYSRLLMEFASLLNEF